VTAAMRYYHDTKFVFVFVYWHFVPALVDSYNLIRTNHSPTIKWTQHCGPYSEAFTFAIRSRKQVAQLSQRDRAAVWVSRGANINVVFRIQRTLLWIAVAVSFTC